MMIILKQRKNRVAATSLKYNFEKEPTSQVFKSIVSLFSLSSCMYACVCSVFSFFFLSC